MANENKIVSEAFALLIIILILAWMPSCSSQAIATTKPVVVPKSITTSVVTTTTFTLKSTVVEAKVVPKESPKIELPFESKVMEIAKSYSYVRELTNNNDAPEIDQMLDYQGLPHRLSWCLAFCVWDYYKASVIFKIKNPLPKMARVSQFFDFAKTNKIRFKVVYPDDIKLGSEKLQKADVVCFSHAKVAGNNNWNGHAELVDYQIDRRSFKDWGGNTIAEGAKGSDREGGGIFSRTRYLTIKGLNAEGFVRVRIKS